MKRKGCETSRLGQLAEASTPMPRTLGTSLVLRHKQPTLVSMSRCVDVWGGLPDNSEAQGLLPTIQGGSTTGALGAHLMLSSE